MNNAQKKIINIGVVFIILMFSCPPWKFALSKSDVIRPGGYHLIISPPAIPVNGRTNYKSTTIEDEDLFEDRCVASWSAKIDLMRLTIQTLMVMLAVFGLCVNAKNKSNN
jgi:hypothetical protein